MTLDPVRRAAWRVLAAVADRGPLDGALGCELSDLPEARDRAFLAELVRGTLQWQGRYDHVLGRFVKKGLPRDAGLLAVLRMALHQLLTLDSVPPFAAIDQAVELCKAQVGPRKAGFVNGTLRAVHRHLEDGKDHPRLDRSAREARLRPLFSGLEQDRVLWMAAWHSHPPWLVKKWLKAYGPERTEELLRFNNAPVPVDFRILEPMTVAEAGRLLGEAGCATCPAGSGRGLRAVDRPGRAVLDDLLARFDWLIVQDATVQAATDWLGGFLAGVVEGPVVDLCAAPGGKAVALAARLGTGRDLLAMDPDPARLDLLVSTVERTGQRSVHPVLGDGLRPPLPLGAAAAVLLDGPCSGTGVLRHHPEARWRMRPQTPANKAKLLGELALQAVDLLASGGLLLYATCSLEAEENIGVLDRLRRLRPDLEPVADAEGTWHRLWLPPHAPGDGFFAAVLRRTAGNKTGS